MFKKLLLMVTLILAVTFILTGCGANSSADKQESNSAEKTSLDKIKEKGKLYIGVKADYPPFGSIDKDGKNIGFEIDMAHRLAEDLFGDPNKIEFVPVTGANRIPYLQSNKIDVILCTMGVTEERATQVEFSKPYFKSGTQLLVPQNSSIKEWGDLNGKKVIYMPGGVAEKEIMIVAPETEIIKMTDTSSSLQALMDERADAYAQDNVLLYDLARKNTEYKVVCNPISEGTWAMAARKGEKDVADWLNKNVDKWQSEGYMIEIYEKWLEVNTPGGVDPSIWLNVN